jgi:hypothetical protein
MPILVKGEARPAEVLCVRGVRVGIPGELLDEVQRFYALALGLKAWPEESQIPGGWGVGNPQCGLYLEFRHDPETDPMRRRFTLMVGSLAALEERLLRREWPYGRVRGFGWSDQCILLQDPVGHLIEVRQTHPL